MWNVNISAAQMMFFRLFVLIETLWNVNSLSLRPADLISAVLIETLWNVNQVSGETYYEEY